jgi:hypothetical protein
MISIRSAEAFRLLFSSLFIFLCTTGSAQNYEKIVFNSQDSLNDYYLAIRPLSGNIQGVQVLLCGFMPPETVLAETKLHNVAYGNDILTIMVSVKDGFAADSSMTERMNAVLRNVITHFSADTSKFVLGGYMYAGNIILRYTEMCFEHPSSFPILPKAVFTIDCPVDLIGLAQWSEREIKKNYASGIAGDGKYILNVLTKNYGSYTEQKEKYIQLSAFTRESAAPGNERFLAHVPVRLYYDTDISWELNSKRNSYYDTNVPDGSELVNRLLLEGNAEAEFISSKLPGIRSNGLRTTHSWSIVDEVDCILWEKEKLGIFNAPTYKPDYKLAIPIGWPVERFALPPDFAKQIVFRGIEDVRFAPGWGDIKSEEYWSYAFLWRLEGNPEINATILQDNLKIYYTGLITRNIPIRKIPADKITPVVVALLKVKTVSGDAETYSGTIQMLDYMAQKPMTLHALIHKKSCPDQAHGFLFFEISPQQPANSLWLKMNDLYSGFECSK